MAEALVFEGKIINRRGSVDDKNTASDYRPIEIDRQHSVHSSLLYTVYNNKKINLIDVPGFSDFVGDSAAALNVCDTALFMINGQSGVEATTEIAWRQTEIANCRLSLQLINLIITVQISMKLLHHLRIILVTR